MINYKEILRRRTQLGISQEAVARAAKISLQTMGRIERGESDPRFSTAVAIAKALNLTVNDLTAEIVEAAAIIQEDG